MDEKRNDAAVGEDTAIAILAAANTACAIPIVRALTPIRRQTDAGETGQTYYMRVYWIPGSVLLIAAIGVARTFGLGFEDLGADVYVAGTGLCCALAWGTHVRKQRLGF